MINPLLTNIDRIPTTESEGHSENQVATQQVVLEHWIWIRLRIFVTLFLCYVVSIGPCYWWWYESRFLDAPIWVAVFYEPLFKLSSFIPWLGDLIDAYIKWWVF
jgi:hypothetical protein